MENEYIRITTEEIREGQRKEDTRIAWEINEIKQKPTAKKKANVVMREKEGKIQSETRTNLETMRRYIKHPFARVREMWEINCLPCEVWNQKSSRIIPTKGRQLLQTKARQLHNPKLRQQK